MIRSDRTAKAASSPVCTVNGDPHSSSRVSFDGTSAAWVMIAASATERTMRKADEIPMLSFPFLERSRIRITVRVHMSTYTGKIKGQSKRTAKQQAVHEGVSQLQEIHAKHHDTGKRKCGSCEQKTYECPEDGRKKEKTKQERLLPDAGGAMAADRKAPCHGLLSAL